LDHVIAERADAQGGVVEHSQLIALGLGARSVPRWVARGRLYVVYPGVYAVGHRVLGREGREWAAVLATTGVLSHRSAGAKLGVVTWNGRPEVTTARGRRAPYGVIAHSARALHADDVVLDAQSRLPCTRWARTTIDLTELYDLDRMTRYLERSEIERRYDGLTLAPAMTRAHGRHGLPTLIAALNRGHHLNPQSTRSPQEEDYLRELRKTEGDYRLNHWMWVHDRFIEADVWFPQQRLIVELDSRWHDTAGARERDAAGDEACRRAGIEVRRLRPYSSAPSSRSTRRRIASDEAYVESMP
jgi:very-short-patch-repair endonuclease